mmetsp:Transcript_13890/g.54868  ORF Transcript_13890/g.54868 Transcript_13890/m.54868 type:complete len:261 (+) Transcript_13890:605-1387(+)
MPSPLRAEALTVAMGFWYSFAASWPPFPPTSTPPTALGHGRPSWPPSSMASAAPSRREFTLSATRLAPTPATATIPSRTTYPRRQLTLSWMYCSHSRSRRSIPRKAVFRTLPRAHLGPWHGCLLPACSRPPSRRCPTHCSLSPPPTRHPLPSRFSRTLPFPWCRLRASTVPQHCASCCLLSSLVSTPTTGTRPPQLWRRFMLFFLPRWSGSSRALRIGALSSSHVSGHCSSMREHRASLLALAMARRCATWSSLGCSSIP